MSPGPSPDGIAREVRASDQERERVVGRLHAATAEGRLTAEELDERVGAAYTARTRGDLSRLMDDLPAEAPGAVPGPALSRAASRRRRRGRPRPRRLGVALVLVAILFGVGSVAGDESSRDLPDADVACSGACERAIAAAERVVPGGTAEDVEEEPGGWQIRMERFGEDDVDVFVDRSTGRAEAVLDD